MGGRSWMLMEQRRFEWASDDVPSLGSDEVPIETRTGAVSIGTEFDIASSDLR